MKFAIILELDAVSKQKINKLRQCFIENGIENNAYEVSHISLSDIETDDNVERIIEITKSLSNTKQFALCLSSVGTFMTKNNVIFLSPTLTNDLKLIHKKCNLNFSGFKLDEYYKLNSWVPHCTIAQDISDEDLVVAFKLIKENNLLPLNVNIENISVVQHDKKPFNQIAKFKLK